MRSTLLLRLSAAVIAFCVFPFARGAEPAPPAEPKPVFSEEERAALSDRKNKAESLVAEGKFAEGEKELRAVLEMVLPHLGPDEPGVISCRYALALALNGLARHEDAQEQHRAVVSSMTRTRGPEDPDTLRCRNNLASTMGYRKKFSEAAAEHYDIWVIRQRVLGPDHPDTLDSRYYYADALEAQGNSADAEAEFRALIQSLKSADKQRADRSVLRARLGLANAMGNQGKFADAERELREVQPQMESLLGAEHPETLRLLYNLCLFLKSQEKKDEFLTTARRTKALAQKILPEDNPLRVACEKLESD